MNVKILLALVALVLGAVGGYVVLESRNDAEEAERSAGVEPAPATTDEAAEAARSGEAVTAEPPTFELVRVEPTGDLVAAGLATPGALVELLEGDNVLAGTQATVSGEWALVLDAPLGVGSHDLALRATLEGGEPVYGDRVAIVVPDDGSSPLVAVTSEGQPSRIVQRPETEEAGELVAAAGETEGTDETGTQPEPDAEAGQELAMAAPPQEDEAGAPAANEQEAATGEISGGAQPGADVSPEQDLAMSAPAEDGGEEQPVTAAEEAQPDEEATGQVAAASPGQEETMAAEETSGETSSEEVVADAPAEEDAGEQQLAMAAPTEDDAEPATASGTSDGDVSGEESGSATSETDAPVLPEEVAPSAMAEPEAASDETSPAGDLASREDGEETSPAAGETPSDDAAATAGAEEQGEQEVAAAEAEAGQASPAVDGTQTERETAAASETDGEAAPRDETPAAAEEEPSGTEMAALPEDRGGEPATGGAPQTSGTASAAGADVKIDTVEVEEPGRLMMSGEATPDQPVRLYVNNEQVGEVVADATGNWFLTASREMPPGQYEVRADAVDRSGGVSARSAVRFERVQVAFAGESGTSGGTASGSGSVNAEGASVSGRGSASGTSGLGGAGDASVVMINRGDNLWTIARKLYGRGVRYTVIYDANRSQIRDPSLIYPGQVFTVPELLGEIGESDQPG